MTDRQIACQRREKLINSVLELLTNPEIAPSPEEVFHWQFVGQEFGGTEHLDLATTWADDKPDLQEELLCGLLYDVHAPTSRVKCTFMPKPGWLIQSV